MGECQRKLQTICFYQFTIHYLTIKSYGSKTITLKIRLDKVDKFPTSWSKLGPDFVFALEKPDSRLKFCLFTTSWFQDPDVKSRSGFGLFLHGLKLDSSYFLTPSTRVCATLGDAEDQCCARANAMWIINMNVRAYAAVNRKGDIY